MKSLAMVLALFSVSASALALELIMSNDLVQDGNAYRVAGPDPFLVLPLTSESVSYSSSAAELTVFLGINRDTSSSDEPVTTELFYQTNLEESFSPQKRLKLSVPATGFDAFSVTLPPRLELLPDSYVRIDLNACADCRITPTTEYSSARMAQAGLLRAYLGTRIIPPSGLDFGTNFSASSGDDWDSHDIELIGKQWLITGADPYLVSPYIDADTSQLGGVLFDLSSTNSAPTVHDFQLFYATENHQFIEKASSIIRVKNNGQQIRFLIPLDFLSDEFVAEQSLAQLRLDLVIHDTTQNAQTPPVRWQLQEARLINKSEMQEYAQLIPSGLVHSKLQRQNKWQIATSIINKLAGDMLFLLTYGLLLIGFLVWWVILIRRYSHV